jgi:hypothetical protein
MIFSPLLVSVVKEIRDYAYFFGGSSPKFSPFWKYLLCKPHILGSTLGFGPDFGPDFAVSKIEAGRLPRGIYDPDRILLAPRDRAFADGQTGTSPWFCLLFLYLSGDKCA